MLKRKLLISNIPFFPQCERSFPTIFGLLSHMMSKQQKKWLKKLAHFLQNVKSAANEPIYSISLKNVQPNQGLYDFGYAQIMYIHQNQLILNIFLSSHSSNHLCALATMYYSLECFWHYIAQWLAQMHFETHTHTSFQNRFNHSKTSIQIFPNDIYLFIINFLGITILNLFYTKKIIFCVIMNVLLCYFL